MSSVERQRLTLKCGLIGFTDPSLISCQRFYPTSCRNGKDRPQALRVQVSHPRDRHVALCHPHYAGGPRLDCSDKAVHRVPVPYQGVWHVYAKTDELRELAFRCQERPPGESGHIELRQNNDCHVGHAGLGVAEYVVEGI